MLNIIKIKWRFLILCLISIFATFTSATDLKLYATNYPPFDIQNTPAQPGFDVEVAIAAFAAAGVNTNVQFHPWARIMRDVKSGMATGAVTCSDVEERNSFVNLSDQISATRVAMVTRKDYKGAPLKAAEDMRGRKVITINGYATQKELIKKDIQHLSVNRVEDALNVLLRRDQEVFYIGWEAAAYTAKQMGALDKLNFAAVAKIDAHPFYVCFSKRWPESEALVKTFNQGLKVIQTNGVLKDIYARYGL